MKVSAKEKAIQDGYNFTGIYNSLKGKTQQEAKKLRKDGYFVRVIFVPSSKYARGHGCGGYSAYSKPTEKKAKELAFIKHQKEVKRLDDLVSIRTYLSTRNRDELMELFMEAKGGELGLLRWAKKMNITK